MLAHVLPLTQPKATVGAYVNKSVHRGASFLSGAHAASSCGRTSSVVKMTTEAPCPGCASGNVTSCVLLASDRATSPQAPAPLERRRGLLIYRPRGLSRLLRFSSFAALLATSCCILISAAIHSRLNTASLSSVPGKPCALFAFSEPRYARVCAVSSSGALLRDATRHPRERQPQYVVVPALRTH